jgi:hypothetical protein
VETDAAAKPSISTPVLRETKFPRAAFVGTDYVFEQ